MRIAYIRVSTIEQNEQRQTEAMQRYDIEKWFTENVSAKDTNRPKLQELLEFAREGGHNTYTRFFKTCQLYKGLT